MTEFCFGDRVEWQGVVGTVVDERHSRVEPRGDFQCCLPLPVAVAFDDGTALWCHGEELSCV